MRSTRGGASALAALMAADDSEVLTLALPGGGTLFEAGETIRHGLCPARGPARRRPSRQSAGISGPHLAGRSDRRNLSARRYSAHGNGRGHARQRIARDAARGVSRCGSETSRDPARADAHDDHALAQRTRREKARRHVRFPGRGRRTADPRARRTPAARSGKDRRAPGAADGRASRPSDGMVFRPRGRTRLCLLCCRSGRSSLGRALSAPGRPELLGRARRGRTAAGCAVFRGACDAQTGRSAARSSRPIARVRPAAARGGKPCAAGRSSTRAKAIRRTLRAWRASSPAARSASFCPAAVRAATPMSARCAPCTNTACRSISSAARPWVR